MVSLGGEFHRRHLSPSLLLVSAILGILAGGVVWLFLYLMRGGQWLLWDWLPGQVSSALLPLVVCLVGGVLIGLWNKKFGAYPQPMEAVLPAVKETHRYDSRPTLVLFGSALLPLIFGASIGPEAGLVGIVAALCTWVGDRFQYTIKGIRQITAISAAATVGVLFRAPLFGFLAENEPDEDQAYSFPNRAKVLLYFTTVLCGLGVFWLLNRLTGHDFDFAKFDAATVGTAELRWAIPLLLIGIAGGYLYEYLSVILGKLPVTRFPVRFAVLCGLVLGISATLFPLALFSGEKALGDLISQGSTMTAPMLALNGTLKLVLTAICIHLGWRGGHIFPLLFAGAALGFGFAALTGVDPVFAAAVMMAAISGVVIRKPLTVILLMLICFPVVNLLILIPAAVAGSYVPTGWLKTHRAADLAAE